ncbi:hypothetical protein [uncultured Eubacterium sp.]|uniref:hypothetical protein n=1 Tax=uncultured Eubacterium sp. TaxID=165185 RepID=UPI0026713484|nr:hypothetical protein [uncultured Eubacterium sp.]
MHRWTFDDRLQSRNAADAASGDCIRVPKKSYIYVDTPVSCEKLETREIGWDVIV